MADRNLDDKLSVQLGVFLEEALDQHRTDLERLTSYLGFVMRFMPELKRHVSHHVLGRLTKEQAASRRQSFERWESGVDPDPPSLKGLSLQDKSEVWSTHHSLPKFEEFANMHSVLHALLTLEGFLKSTFKILYTVYPERLGGEELQQAIHQPLSRFPSRLERHLTRFDLGLDRLDESLVDSIKKYYGQRNRLTHEYTLDRNNRLLQRDDPDQDVDGLDAILQMESFLGGLNKLFWGFIREHPPSENGLRRYSGLPEVDEGTIE